MAGDVNLGWFSLVFWFSKLTKLTKGLGIYIMKQKLQLEEQNLAAIESLLSLSLRGIHQLFDHKDIAQILRTPTEELDFFSFENMTKVQALFLELIQCQSFEEKKDFLQKLDKNSYELVLRAYFHIVENTAMASTDLKH